MIPYLEDEPGIVMTISEMDRLWLIAVANQGNGDKTAGLKR